MMTNWFPSVLWHCWFGHLACNNRPRMTYNVSSGTLNPTHSLTHHAKAQNVFPRAFYLINLPSSPLVLVTTWVTWVHLALCKLISPLVHWQLAQCNCCGPSFQSSSPTMLLALRLSYSLQHPLSSAHPPVLGPRLLHTGIQQDLLIDRSCRPKRRWVNWQWHCWAAACGSSTVCLNSVNVLMKYFHHAPQHSPH